jgi:hypothetical protein
MATAHAQAGGGMGPAIVRGKMGIEPHEARRAARSTSPTRGGTLPRAHIRFRRPGRSGRRHAPCAPAARGSRPHGPGVRRNRRRKPGGGAQDPRCPAAFRQDSAPEPSAFSSRDSGGANDQRAYPRIVRQSLEAAYRLAIEGMLEKRSRPTRSARRRRLCTRTWTSSSREWVPMAPVRGTVTRSWVRRARSTVARRCFSAASAPVCPARAVFASRSATGCW